MPVCEIRITRREVASNVMVLIACKRKKNDRSNQQCHGLGAQKGKGSNSGKKVLEALGEQVLRSVHDHIVWARQPAVTGERLPQRLQPSKEIFLPKKTTNTQTTAAERPKKQLLWAPQTTQDVPNTRLVNRSIRQGMSLQEVAAAKHPRRATALSLKGPSRGVMAEEEVVQTLEETLLKQHLEVADTSITRT
ncbi:MAG: hypothetical protein FRX49_00121 [Trebouxia sp. A1-2]|nr:MAG: hypothetical protein FRX49_00121 [Trebouxia sp. A1-2]